MNVYKSLQIESTMNNYQNTEEVRIAYLFMVHGRSLRQIKRLLKWLYNPLDYFFFHVDSRSSYLYREIKELEKKYPDNIKVSVVMVVKFLSGTVANQYVFTFQ